MSPHLNFSHEPMSVIWEGVEYIEEWLPIKGYDDDYLISSFGRVMSVENNIIMKQWVNDKRYLVIGIGHGNTKKRFKVHRLVGIAFIPNPFIKPEINHDNFDKFNNFYKNLLWATGKENTQHYYKSQPPRKIIEKVGEHPIKCQKIVDTSTGEIFGTVYQLAEETGYTPNYLRKMLRNEVRNTTNYKWVKGQWTLFYKKRHDAAVKRFNELKPIIYGVAI